MQRVYVFIVSLPEYLFTTRIYWCASYKTSCVAKKKKKEKRKGMRRVYDKLRVKLNNHVSHATAQCSNVLR